MIMIRIETNPTNIKIILNFKRYCFIGGLGRDISSCDLYTLLPYNLLK